MNNVKNLSKDSLAILLICSNLSMNNKEESIKPYTTKQWNVLTDRLINSSMKRPSAFFETREEDWKKELFLSIEEVNRLNKLLSRAGQLGIELESLFNLGIGVTTRAEKNYPQKLKDILKKNSPPIIFYCGDISLVENKGVSIVGSRNIDERGLDFTKKISEKCVLGGFNIVSGGAKGVDSVAQNIALQNGGKVISFVADSLVQKIKKKEVREDVMRGNLLLLSAINPKSGFTVFSAMDRNKYIYGLSNYAIIVSSDYNKGGTWAGAIENFENVWVPMFVRKEEKIPKGNEELLNKGVKSISLDVFEAKNISIENWLKENSTVHKINRDFEQININNLLNNSREEIITEVEKSINKIENKMHDEIKINTAKSERVKEADIQEMNLNSCDLYHIVLPYIVKALVEPLSIIELCEMFKINKSQMNEWLNKACDEEKIKKLSKPVRYIVTQN